MNKYKIIRSWSFQDNRENTLHNNIFQINEKIEENEWTL